MIHSKDQEKETDTTHLMHNVRINFLTLKTHEGDTQKKLSYFGLEYFRDFHQRRRSLTFTFY